MRGRRSRPLRSDSTNLPTTQPQPEPPPQPQPQPQDRQEDDNRRRDETRRDNKHAMRGWPRGLCLTGIPTPPDQTRPYQTRRPDKTRSADTGHWGGYAAPRIMPHRNTHSTRQKTKKKRKKRRGGRPDKTSRHWALGRLRRPPDYA